MEIKKTTINLPADEHDALSQLADRRRISFTQVLRQAIQSELFIQRLVDQGAKLLVQSNRGDLQQLVFTQAAPSASTEQQAQPLATAGG